MRNVSSGLRKPPTRAINIAGFLACAAAMAYALYAQHVQGLEPCHLCIFQRVTVLALGAVFLIAAVHGARGWGRYVYAALLATAAVATVAVAGRHLYIQSLPPGTVPSCGAPLEVMLQFSPLTKVIADVFKGGGECAEVNWAFLGLSMPAWVVLLAVVLGVLGVWANVRRVGPPPLTVKIEK
jgi:disulfide bond formation protein DsbB